MANLTRTLWPLGWTPSASELGDPSGLLRADNLTMDETGALTLARGLVKQYDLSGVPVTIFSRNIDGVEKTYIGLDGGTIVRDGAVIASGTDRPCFGDAFGKVFISAGTTRKKDSGGTLRDLGMQKPTTPPDYEVQSQIKVELTAGSWEMIEGHNPTNEGDSYKVYVATDTLRGVVKKSGGGETNTLAMGGDITNYDPNQDTFYFLLQMHDPTLFTRFRVEILLDDDTNYFWHEWRPDTDPFLVGINQQSVLSCKRSDFTRQGDDTLLGWDKVTGVRVSGEATADTYFLTGEHRFVGGPRGQLSGFYKYAFQAIYNDGTYEAKSPLSPACQTVYVENGRVVVGPIGQSDANEYWIYRRSVIEQVESNLVQSHLDKWYFVGSVTSGTLEDSMSDTQAIELNIVPSEYLVSVKDITDSILDMEGLDGGRMLYMTFKELLLTDFLNPDAIDTRFVFRVSGDSTEKNLWIRKITNQTRILATTKDLYEISGTLGELPDGSLDISIRAIGEAFPPISSNVAAANGGLFYAAKDGWRITNGSNSTLLSQEMDQLWAGKDCHGVPGISILPGISTAYPIAIGRDRLYAVAPLTDGSRRLFILNLATKQWELRYIDPIALGVSTSGHILAGFGGGSGNSLYYVGESDSDIGVPITLKTVFDHNGQPRNRKDTFTLKLVMDTGGSDVSVLLGKDGGSPTNLGNVSSDGIRTFYFKLDGLTLGFRYSLNIVDVDGDITRFKLTEYTIEYDPRPEQVNYLRIPSTNLSTLARKRFISYAFVIDTLGHDITFTPYVDGTAKTTSICTKSQKLTFIHFFLENTEGIDIGGLLTGAGQDDVFEYYGPNLEETVSEKLPPPARFLVIPASDYGNPNRKRHTSYKFAINTRGGSVRFTPRVDGVAYAAMDFSTTEKRIVEYFFDVTLDVVGIDIGGTLQSLSALEFEYYGTIVPQTLEVLPDRLRSLYINTTNFGVAAKKRIRTVPLIIDTRGTDCVYTPRVDGVDYPPATFNTDGKRTVYYFFITDVFGIDVGGSLISQGDAEHAFEFYGFGEPVDVETLPPPKKFDQFQPMRFDKIGKLFTIRIRAIFTGTTTSVPFSIYSEASPTLPGNSSALYSSTFPVVPNVDSVYEINLPHNVNLTTMRLTLGPCASEFHRFDVQVRVAQSGMQSSSKWVTLN